MTGTHFSKRNKPSKGKKLKGGKRDRFVGYTVRLETIIGASGQASDAVRGNNSEKRRYQIMTHSKQNGPKKDFVW